MRTCKYCVFSIKTKRHKRFCTRAETDESGQKRILCSPASSQILVILSSKTSKSQNSLKTLRFVLLKHAGITLT